MSLIDLQIERAVAGGRMLARHDGVVVLVAGAIPGECVRARIERSSRSLIWARVEEVIEASPARRPAGQDPACGGMDYAHIAYEDQLRFKRDVMVDTFQRIGRIAIARDVSIEPSPEHGYRLRARLHVDAGRAGFVREGTHVLCDAAATGQLLAESLPPVERVLSAIGDRAREVSGVVIAENVAASQRVLHLEARDGARLNDLRVDASALGADLTGITTTAKGRVVGLAGARHVSDTADELFAGDAPIPPDTTWTRQAASFFQGNRYVTGALTRAVLDSIEGARVADLYAGVGLFAVALAAQGRRVLAVEGDQTSSRDLDTNAAPYADRLRVVRASVEDAARTLDRASFDAVVLDPPRTGVSAEALNAVIALAAPHVVYVSCDPATLARDSARLVAAGYQLGLVRGFDMFPNTAHVESVVRFSRGA